MATLTTRIRRCRTNPDFTTEMYAWVMRAKCVPYHFHFHVSRRLIFPIFLSALRLLALQPESRSENREQARQLPTVRLTTSRVMFLPTFGFPLRSEYFSHLPVKATRQTLREPSSRWSRSTEVINSHARRDMERKSIRQGSF